MPFVALLESIPLPSLSNTPDFLWKSHLFPKGKLIRDEVFFRWSVHCFPDCSLHRYGKSLEKQIQIWEVQDEAWNAVFLARSQMLKLLAHGSILKHSAIKCFQMPEPEPECWRTWTCFLPLPHVTCKILPVSGPGSPVTPPTLWAPNIPASKSSLLAAALVSERCQPETLNNVVFEPQFSKL